MEVDIYVLRSVHPTAPEKNRTILAYTSLEKALDGRRAKRYMNVPWHEVRPGLWTTQSKEYVNNLWAYYVVEKVTLDG